MAITKSANSHANVKQSTNADTQPSQLSLTRLISMFDAVVGSPAQVSTGAATHSSLQSAINYVSGLGGGAIFFLSATITENVTLSTNNITVLGKGHTAVLNGNLSVSGSYNDIGGIRVSGNYIVNGNNNYNKAWISSTSTFTDAGLANANTISQE